ncbi:MAG TPA: NAD(P)-dependent oxidoreductase [Stenotrophomonas sp.]|nr:NAD(P)-dependent oxidoreductase [Stenotrophomonas sp.]
MRILLTGASGLIGQAVHKSLSDDNEVVTLGRSAGADVRLDLADVDGLNSAALPPADALVHCAGIVDEDFREDPIRAARMAMFGAGALVRQAVAAGATRLAYISSAHVYGPMLGHMDERSPPNPVSDYAISHYATEQVFRRYAQGTVTAAAFRPCAVFGTLGDLDAFRRWTLIPFSFPREAVIDRRIVIRSTGQQRRNFVGTDDIADSVRHWLDATASGWQVINPVGETSCTVFEFAQRCAAISDEVATGKCIVERQHPSGPQAGDDFEYASILQPTTARQSIDDFARGLMSQLLLKATP